MCNSNTDQTTEVSVLLFIRKLRNFMYIVTMQSNGADIVLAGSGFGRICPRISGHIWFRSDFKNL